MRQRAKFEGWLKVRVAHLLEGRHNLNVRLEAKYQGAHGRHLADLLVKDGGFSAWVMLKTCNTNFRFPGVVNETRPITMNIAQIVEDVAKLRGQGDRSAAGYVCLPMFPVSTNREKRSKQMQGCLERVERAGCALISNRFVPRSPEFGIAAVVGRVE